MGGERGVEAVGEQRRYAGALGAVDRFVGEPGGSGRLPGVRPATSQCGSQASPCFVVDRADEYVVQLGRESAWHGPEEVDRCRAEHGSGPPVQVVGVPAARRSLVVQARRGVSPTGQAGGVGTVEEVADLG